MNLYNSLLLSCDQRLARVICRHLLSLSRTRSEVIKEAIFVRIVLPIFVHCTTIPRQEEEGREKWLCLMELCLLTMSQLLGEVPHLVGSFLGRDLLPKLEPLLECVQLRLLALDLLSVLIGSSQQLVDDQPECHPTALMTFDKTLASCNVPYFLRCMDSLRDQEGEGEEVVWSGPVQDLFFCSSVWHSCQHLSGLPAFRKHLLSGKGLGASFQLLEATLDALALPCTPAVRRTVVVLLESLLSLCLQLVPFYVIQDSQYMTGEGLLQMVQARLLKCNAVNTVWLRQVYDSLLNCSVDVSSTLRAPTVSWAFQKSEEEDLDSLEGSETLESRRRGPVDSDQDDGGSSCLGDLESEAAQDRKGSRMAQRRQVIVRPQVAGLVLRLLWNHLRGSPRKGKEVLEGANYLLQRLAALCKQDPANKTVLHEQEVLQYIYNFLDTSFGYEESSLAGELQIALVDLWVCVSVQSISRTELFAYLRFIRDRPQATVRWPALIPYGESA